MNRIIALVLLLLTQYSFANMASPVREGTRMARPFLSRHVDILKETIRILPDANFQTAEFFIEYQIRVNQAGKQIPLLFYAADFQDDFKIWLNDREIELSPVPDAYQQVAGTPFQDFGYFFEPQNANQPKEVTIDDSPVSGFVVTINDLKFFETDLPAGTHTLRVRYTAAAWVDRSNWVKEYSFRYVLSPAKYWKSFGTLEITLDASRCHKAISSNLGMPVAGSDSSQRVWTFSALPTEVLLLTHQPPAGSIASLLIAISPTGLAGMAFLLFAALHYRTMQWYRRKKPTARIVWPLPLGVLVVPLLTIAAYLFSFDVIDAAIGAEAGRYHGYPFTSLLLYPLLLPVYGIIIWMAGKRIRPKTTA